MKNSANNLHTKVLRRQRENKQTNMPFRVWELALRRLHLYIQPVKAVGLLPFDPNPPQGLLPEQSPHCVRPPWGASLGQRQAALHRWLLLRPSGRAEVGGGVWGLGIYQGAE